MYTRYGSLELHDLPCEIRIFGINLNVLTVFSPDCVTLVRTAKGIQLADACKALYAAGLLN